MVEPRLPDEEQDLGWSWFVTEAPPAFAEDDFAKAVQACFAGRNGDVVIEHLRQTFLERRVPPSASDAELRHIEGQRTAIAFLIRLARHRG
jgi:hypothetical protein